MRKLLILLFICSQFNQLFSRELNIKFDLFTDKPEIHYSLELYKGRYNLIANYYFSGGSVVELFLSYGSYNFDGRIIELNDAVHKYKFKYLYFTSYIISKQTFYSIMNKKLFRTCVIKGKNFREFNLDASIAEKKRAYNRSFNKTYNTCYLGKYLNQGYLLELLSKSSFKYSYEGNVLLLGTFKRVNNELQLYDFSLKHTFYFPIYNKTIIENFITFGDELKHESIAKSRY